MTRTHHIALLILGILLALIGSAFPASASAAAHRYTDKVFSSFVTTHDLQYGRVIHPDGRIERLFLDLYRPKGDTASKRPVVIFIHGGDSAVDKRAWRNRILSEGFALRGFVAASIQYRKGTNGTSRGAGHDIRAAVRWFRAKAAFYRIDPSRIVLMGSSAGAIGALNAAFNPEDAGSSGNASYSSRVAGAISVGGMATDHGSIGFGDPPIAMFHAADDKVIPYESALLTCEETKIYGNVCEMYRWEKGGHPPPFLNNNREKILELSSWFMWRNVIN